MDIRAASTHGRATVEVRVLEPLFNSVVQAPIQSVFPQVTGLCSGVDVT